MTEPDLEHCAECGAPIRNDDPCFVGVDTYHPACCPDCRSEWEADQLEQTYRTVPR